MEIYFDDMIIKSCEMKEHIKDLEEVFAKVRNMI